MQIALIDLYRTVCKYAHDIGNIPEGAKLAEVCDFGDSFGFLFYVDDIFGNVYWCVEKDTYKPYTFRPNQDIKKYSNRKLLAFDEGWK